ncbi:hypothetical protein VTI74DRAFT_11126 [Chaetomium olivicolor]
MLVETKLEYRDRPLMFDYIDLSYASYRQLKTPVQGSRPQLQVPGGVGDAVDALRLVLADVDPKTEVLHIDADTLINGERDIVARHFTNVRFFKVTAGWCEDRDDANFRLNWPLEMLVITDAAGQLVTTPAILEGRIPYLVYYYAASMRIEVPTNK